MRNAWVTRFLVLTESVIRWKRGHIGAEFTEDGLNTEHVKARDSRQVDAEDTFQMAVEIKARHGWACGTGRIGGSGGAVVVALERFNALLNFLVAVGNEFLVVTVSRQRLLEREDVLRTIVTNQALGHGFDGGFDPVVAQFG